MHIQRAEIGHDGKGRVLAWKHVIVGQSIMSGTPFEPFTVKDGIDSTMVEGVAESAYPFPIALEAHHPKSTVPVWPWASVGPSTNPSVLEPSGTDSPARAGLGPLPNHPRLLRNHPGPSAP